MVAAQVAARGVTLSRCGGGADRAYHREKLRAPVRCSGGAFRRIADRSNLGTCARGSALVARKSTAARSGRRCGTTFARARRRGEGRRRASLTHVTHAQYVARVSMPDGMCSICWSSSGTWKLFERSSSSKKNETAAREKGLLVWYLRLAVQED